MDALLGIGQFSKMTYLSVKALRHYHDVGLLEPAAVDPATGYRQYSVGQVGTAQAIRRFRDLEMPIEEVRRVLRAPDEASPQPGDPRPPRADAPPARPDPGRGGVAPGPAPPGPGPAHAGRDPPAPRHPGRGGPGRGRLRGLRGLAHARSTGCGGRPRRPAWRSPARTVRCTPTSSSRRAGRGHRLRAGGGRRRVRRRAAGHDRGRAGARRPVRRPRPGLRGLGTAVAEMGVAGPGPIREHYLDRGRTEVCWPVAGAG